LEDYGTFFLPAIAGHGRNEERRCLMTRTLPPRPDFTQLKHQAKDLLRAHERKDASACPALRRLRRFASADDAGILAQPLALHEAQYALALEYGFASWNALKRYVEKVTGRPSPVRREKDRTYVAGLEGHGIGCKDEHDNSVIACIAGVMAALGEDFSYPYLMGASGAAFRVQLHQPNWCPSAACAPCGYDCVPGAMAVTGYRLTWISTGIPGPAFGKCEPRPEGVVKAGPAIATSIERGVPVIFGSEESGLVVGYRPDGQRILRPYEHQKDGYVDTDKWPWETGIIEPHDIPVNRHEAVVNSLRLAVTLANAERFEHYLSGFAALQKWADDLLDESRFAGLTDKNWFEPAHANGYCYPCLWSARLNAEKYLREVAGEFEEPVRSRLLELAGLYQRMHETLSRTKPDFECVWSLQPWMLKSPANWTLAIRQKESDLLREALAIERQAISGIEKVLTLLDQPAPSKKESHHGKN
jgi:hypothetical protein